MRLSETIESYLHSYLPFELRLTKGTIETHFYCLRKFQNIISDKEIQEITHTDCLNFLREVTNNTKLTNSSYNNYVSRLQKFFEYCLLEEWIPKNPASRLRPLREEKRIVTVLTKTELYEVINCRLPYQTSKRRLWARDRALMMFISSTGLRPKEVSGLNWQNINFEEQNVTVPAEIAKNRKERRVYLINETASLLYHYFVTNNPKLSDPVFLTRDNGRLVPSGINKIFVKIMKYLEIERIKSPRVYLLRKTYITHLIKDGVNIEAVASLAGHSNPAITWKYYKEAITFDEAAREVDEKFFMNHSPKSQALEDFQKHIKKREGYVTKRDTFK